jgi:hypothetical protein
MLRASPRQIIVALLAAVVAMVGVAAADARPADVVIRIYDGTAAGAASRAAAVQTAAAIVAEAGIHPAWYDCTDNSQRPECTPSRRGRELIIRIMATPAPGAPVTGGAIATATARTFILGFAVIDPASGVGSLATLFMDRIEAIARRIDVPPSAVLGLTIAHEVGHLLLGTPTHGRSGLMREVWTDEELALGREDDWRFGPSEKRVLQSRRR